MTRLTKKRLQWVVACVSMRGDVHYHRWPCKHPWKNCRCLGRLR